jgi:hypothetical protein
MNGASIPLELQHAGIEYTLDQNKANFYKNKELTGLLDKIRQECIREIHGLLGSKANEYESFCEKRREMARTNEHLFTATPEGRKIKSQFMKERLSEANEFIRRQNINPKDVKSILSKYQEECKSLIEKTRAVKGSLQFVVGTLPPDVVDPDPESPWESIHPPYTYSFGDRYSSHSGEADAFGPFVSHNENSLTGEISCLSQNFIYNAGNHATQTTLASSNILMYFQIFKCRLRDD